MHIIYTHARGATRAFYCDAMIIMMLHNIEIIFSHMMKMNEYDENDDDILKSFISSLLPFRYFYLFLSQLYRSSSSSLFASVLLSIHHHHFVLVLLFLYSFPPYLSYFFSCRLVLCFCTFVILVVKIQVFLIEGFFRHTVYFILYRNCFLLNGRSRHFF